MADIFISYSKLSRGLTEQLATELEAKGFTVWWDAGLVSGESFSDVILKELDAASAAIVIWTKDSVKSQWVRSEARRAQERGVLVPTRSSDLTPKDIPLPFDGLHTDLVSNRTAIMAALARLDVTPPAEGDEESDPIARLEQAAWARIQTRKTVAGLEAFLGDFPYGKYARTAKAELHRLTSESQWGKVGRHALAYVLLIFGAAAWFYASSPFWSGYPLHWLTYYISFSVAVLLTYSGVSRLKTWQWRRPMFLLSCGLVLGAIMSAIIANFGTIVLSCDDPSIRGVPVRYLWWRQWPHIPWPERYDIIYDSSFKTGCMLKTPDRQLFPFTPYKILGVTWLYG
jgi:hypothetical protein